MDELLQDLAYYFNGGKSSFNSLMLMDGTKISDLTQIPKDCKLLVVSKVPEDESNESQNL